MRHVLIVIEGVPYPIDPRVRAQAAALRVAGHRVTVVGPTGAGHDAAVENVGGVRAVRFRAAPGGRGALGYAREWAIALVGARRAALAVHRQDPVDVVLVCNPPDALVEAVAPLQRAGARLVVDYREICPELFEEKFGRRGLLHRVLVASERRALRRADAVITVSGACAQLARERAGVAPERIHLVGNGPDLERVHSVPARPELRRGRDHLVLWLGAMSRQERLDRLVDAAEHVVRDHGRDDVLFAIVGPGDVQEEIRADVAARGLDGAVVVPGRVEDDLVRAYVSTADVCVGVDTKGPMNDRAAMRKILEYMAFGRAVVQFPLAEMRLLCGDACAWARDGDAADLADRVVELIDDPARRAALGRAARARVHNGLLWQQQIPAFLEAIEPGGGGGAAPVSAIALPAGSGSRVA